MNQKEFIKIINEEIQEFDFLGNDEHSKEMEIINLLKNEDFQKQFICDVLLRKTEIKTKEVESSISDDAGGALFRTPNYLNVDVQVDINYVFDQTKEPVEFGLSFVGDNISIHVDSDYDAGRWGVSTDDAVAPSGGDWISDVDWDGFEVNLWTADGDEIPFIAYKNAPDKIRVLFVREFCERRMENSGDYSIELDSKDKVQNIPYC